LPRARNASVLDGSAASASEYAALQGGLRFLFVGFGVAAVSRNQYSRQGERHGDFRQLKT